MKIAYVEPTAEEQEKLHKFAEMVRGILKVDEPASIAAVFLRGIADETDAAGIRDMVAAHVSDLVFGLPAVQTLLKAEFHDTVLADDMHALRYLFMQRIARLLNADEHNVAAMWHERHKKSEQESTPLAKS